MSTGHKHLDLSLLPTQAQTQMMDFYEFLFQKYGTKTKDGEGEARLSDFLSEPIQVEGVVLYSREDLHDR